MNYCKHVQTINAGAGVEHTAKGVRMWEMRSPFPAAPKSPHCEKWGLTFLYVSPQYKYQYNYLR